MFSDYPGCQIKCIYICHKAVLVKKTTVCSNYSLWSQLNHNFLQ